MNIETAKDLRNSKYWEAIVSEIDMLIKSEEIKLRKCSSEELKSIQRAIGLLESIKNIPENVIAREE